MGNHRRRERAAVNDLGGTLDVAVDGRFQTRPDVAVVVFGEDPYAEFQGDRADVAFEDAGDHLALLRRLKAAGIPTVSVFLSGRPLWINPYLNASDAFVAAWLPGSEGGGVADMLVGKADFRGRLPYSWPRTSDQTAVNVGDQHYTPLFPYGYGLTLKDRGELAPLPEVAATGPAQDRATLFAAGRTGQGRRLLVGAAGALSFNPGPDLITMRGADRRAQEDSVRLSWTGRARAEAAIVERAPVDLAADAARGTTVELDLRVDAAPQGPVTLGVACGDTCGGSVRIDAALAAAPPATWTRIAVPLECFAQRGADLRRVTMPLVLSTAAPLTLTLSSARLAPRKPQSLTCKR